MHDNSCYIPCADQDVEIASKVRSALSCLSSSQVGLLQLASRVSSSILCPEHSVVQQTAKPRITAVTSHHALSAFFQLPEYLEMTPMTSWSDALNFVDSHGYPVLVKGTVRDCQLCMCWDGVVAAVARFASSGCFIQKYVHGVDKCLAFAAHEGLITIHIYVFPLFV